MLACGTAFWTFFFTTYRLANYIGERTDLYVIFSKYFTDFFYKKQCFFAISVYTYRISLNRNIFSGDSSDNAFFYHTDDTGK